jgi:CRISPR system Cascade subunit CasC
MNLIELHILQSFPVSCLNRDDVGSPKSAQFGGVRRARISSQSMKRSHRLFFNEEHFGDRFRTTRTKLAHEKLAKLMVEGGVSSEAAGTISLEILSRLVDSKGAAKAKEDKSGRMNMPALIWLSPKQFEDAARVAVENKDELEKTIAFAQSDSKADEKKAKAALKKALDPIGRAIKLAGISDAPDIAMFGRMVANDPSLNIDGAAMYSHAISTHRTDNEIDFYSAVDDVKQQRNESETETEDAGAGMIGTLEFNSATYYRYLAINLDLLGKHSHLGGLTPEERREIIKSFLRAAMIAVPGARQNSMNAGTLPHEVLGIRKPSGQPLQLINAFETPVKGSNQGYAGTSLETMKTHLGNIEKTWGSQGEQHWLTNEGLDSFLDNLTQ